MKCPLCSTENDDKFAYCTGCRATLFPDNERNRSLLKYLTENGLVKDREALCSTVRLKVNINSDDGLINYPESGKEWDIPLYYSKNDIIYLVLKTAGTPDMGLGYYNIWSFLDLNTDSGRNKVEETLGKALSERPSQCGDNVLAEVMPLIADNTISIVVGRRAAMVARMSREDPMMCMYGCPAASHIAERDMNEKINMEIIELG